LKNARNDGKVVITVCAPETPSRCSLSPKSISGFMELAARFASRTGFTRIAISDIENPPHPSPAHWRALSAMILQSSSVSVRFGAGQETMTVCRVTGGDARIVASKTTPKVPPPPGTRYEPGRE
jgi:hypothetical protein